MTKESIMEIHFHISSQKIAKASIITQKLDIQPTSFYNKGDKKKGGREIESLQNDTEWTISTGRRKTFLGDELIDEFLKKLRGKEEVINDIITEYDATTRIDFICVISQKHLPILYLSQKNIELIFKLKACVVYDFYN